MQKTLLKHKKKHAVADDLEKYITQVDRGLAPVLPMKNDGADVSRPLNQMRLAEYHKCPDCRNGLKENPIQVSIQYKTANSQIKCVTLCARHWAKLAEAQIGWSGE